MTPLPDGFRLTLDPSVRTFRDGTVLVGGHPGRAITLTGEGAASLRKLLSTGVTSPATGALGRRLVNAGMAHPHRIGDARPVVGELTLTVVVPVRDRPSTLDRCLGALGDGAPVIVVDDGSREPAAVAAVCHHHRARLITRAVNGGPAAARNQALPEIDTDLVAFVDSDCTVGHGWLGQLLWLFADPIVGAVAPRIRQDRSLQAAPRSALARFSDAHSSLDMGTEESEVGAGRLVRYVPTAALVVRRAALGRGFDVELRVGEDVDLVWRMLDAGWHVRYVPSVTVSHREPASWGELLSRRFRYGTSAGPLALRHPERMAPVELRPWPTAVAVAALAGRPRTALALVVASAAATARSIRNLPIPPALALRWSAQSAGWTTVGIGRAATMLAAPALVVAALHSRRAAFGALVLVAAPVAVEQWRKHPDLDPGRWFLACIADDVAYGAGVWAGCLRSRSFRPLVPDLRHRWA